MRESFQKRFLLKRFGTPPAKWKIYALEELFSERKESSSNLDKYPLYSFTIENGITPKTERYERSFLLKDKDNNEYKLVRLNDLVFNPMNLRFGAIAFSRTSKTVSVSAYYNILILKNSICNLIFIESFLKSHQMMDLYDRAAIGSLIEKRRVHLSEFRKLKVLLPPLPEQEKIAEILGKWDEGIETVEKLIAAKKKMKKGLMQQLLTGKERFKEFERQKWKEYQLHEVVETLFSNVDKKSHENELPVLLCNYTDVYKNQYITDEIPFMQATAKESEVHKFSLKLDDVVITKDSETPDDIANSAVVVKPLKNVLCGYHLAILRPLKNVVSGLFLAHMLMLQVIRHQFSRVANGATRFGLSVGDIKKIPICIPSIDEQQKIALVLNAANKEIELLNKRLEILKQQKKGLMQKLLTGKIRVNV